MPRKNSECIARFFLLERAHNLAQHRDSAQGLLPKEIFAPLDRGGGKIPANGREVHISLGHLGKPEHHSGIEQGQGVAGNLRICGLGELSY